MGRPWRLQALALYPDAGGLAGRGRALPAQTGTGVVGEEPWTWRPSGSAALTGEGLPSLGPPSAPVTRPPEPSPPTTSVLVEFTPDTPLALLSASSRCPRHFRVAQCLSVDGLSPPAPHPTPVPPESPVPRPVYGIDTFRQKVTSTSSAPSGLPTAGTDPRGDSSDLGSRRGGRNSPGTRSLLQHLPQSVCTSQDSLGVRFSLEVRASFADTWSQVWVGIGAPRRESLCEEGRGVDTPLGRGGTARTHTSRGIRLPQHTPLSTCGHPDARLSGRSYI